MSAAARWELGLRHALLDVHVHHTRIRQVSLEDKVAFLIGYERKKCAALLFVGSIFGLLGFAFAFAIGLLKFLEPQLGEFKTRFPSGNGYFPATVSEMVHNPQEPAGKCFFAFEFVGALFIFMSWYPWELRNVYIGDSHCLHGTNLSWSMFRQFVPPCGMMLVATVTTTPFAQATPLDYICITIHVFGAIMLFAGYAMCEAHCLGIGVKQHECMHKVLLAAEHYWRKVCLQGIIACYAAFCGLTVVVVFPLDFGGHNDRWERRDVMSDMGTMSSKVVLVDTASGVILCLKISAYLMEVCCGLFLIASFVSIWYFCEERTTDLQDELFRIMEIAPERSKLEGPVLERAKSAHSLKVIFPDVTAEPTLGSPRRALASYGRECERRALSAHAPLDGRSCCTHDIA